MYTCKIMLHYPEYTTGDEGLVLNSCIHFKHIPEIKVSLTFSIDICSPFKAAIIMRILNSASLTYIGLGMQHTTEYHTS